LNPPRWRPSVSHDRAHEQPGFQENAMKTIILAAALSLVASSALAASCKVEAGSKKLSGAAMTSFMTKCETDAKAACEKDSAAKKLSGAAKDSHMKKCIGDAVGS
jgi:uncharacterized membrane protein